MSLLGSPSDTEEGLMGKQRSPCSADLLVRLCEVCKQKSLNCNLWFVWKVDCRCISRMTIWSHQVVLPLLVSYMGSCSTCVQQSFSPTCDNCCSLWALALLSIHVLVIHNERNTLKASCFPAAALQPATSQLVKRNHIPPVLASLFWTSTFWEVFPLL